MTKQTEKEEKGNEEDEVSAYIMVVCGRGSARMWGTKICENYEMQK